MQKKLNIFVLFGGASSEHTISIRTGSFICKTLQKMGHQVKPILITKEGKWYIPSKFGAEQFLEMDSSDPDAFALAFSKISAPLASISQFQLCDFVFIGLHGVNGEDGRVQGFLETLGLPYSGSGVLGSALAMNKTVSNILYEKSDFLVPKFQEISVGDFLDSPDHFMSNLEVAYPAFLKPVEGGSSYATSRIENSEELVQALKALNREDIMLLQEAVSGIELSCGVLERWRDEAWETIQFSPTEIIPESKFFDTQAKYEGRTREITPARISVEETGRIQQLSLRAHRLLRCQGYSRTDFILTDKGPYVLETNTLPGMTATSLIPQQAKAAGLDMETVLEILIEDGMRKKRNSGIMGSA